VIRDARPAGGIWSGGPRAKASNGPLYEAVCTACDEKLIATPTDEEAEAGVFCWELSTEFPGEKFVATMAPDESMQEFLPHIDSLIEHLKQAGFAARCPPYTFAGILVPKDQAPAAREFLINGQIDYLRVWVSDDEGRPETYIGKK
jgi:hypothetical protein